MSSPIETMLRDAIVDLVEYENRIALLDYTKSPHPAVLDDNLDISIVRSAADLWGAIPDLRDSKQIRACLYAAVRCRSYKLDFVFQYAHALLAIECDGHDFHDRTKQQASSDRARDRELLLLGVPTIRFTGSDIHTDANRCAVEALRIFDSLIERDKRLIEGPWNTVAEFANFYFDEGKTAGLEAVAKLNEEHW